MTVYLLTYSKNEYEQDGVYHLEVCLDIPSLERVNNVLQNSELSPLDEQLYNELIEKGTTDYGHGNNWYHEIYLEKITIT